MKKYKLILMVGILFFVGCSQKDENPKNTTSQITLISKQSKVVVDKPIVKKQTLIVANVTNETISKSYIERVAQELEKLQEKPPVVLLPSDEESEPEASLPAHIRNSTIKSVPR